MKKKFARLLLVMAMLAGGVSGVAADESQSAQVIRVDAQKYDLLVQRQNGELWILQHNPLCNSMTTEFPVNLILSTTGVITQLKVSNNEICKVYNAFPYSGQATLAKRIPSDNELYPEHEAEIVWSETRYRVDYGAGCTNLRDFVGQKVYLSLKGSGLDGGSLVLPGYNGQCLVKTSTVVGDEISAPKNIPPALGNLEFQAQNNQVYFHWDAQAGNPLYLLSYSRNPVNTSLYSWNTMPNLKVIRENAATVTRLANGIAYHFYLAALSPESVPGPWKGIVATPVSPGGLKNNPDSDPFEVKWQEQSDAFLLTWPALEEARKFRLSFYVNGKSQFSSLVPATVTEYRLPKKPEYLGQGLRFTVRSLAKGPYAPTFFDGVYWQYKAKK